MSAAEALQNNTISDNRISLGLPGIDALLSNLERGSAVLPEGGLRRGEVTELIGPPGVGKTHLWSIMLL